MGLFKRSMAVTSINFNCWRQDFRVKFILLFTALIVFNTLKPVLQYGLDNGAVSTPLLLPLLFGSTEISIGTPKICFHVGLILLLCDAPFYYPITPYAIMRSKRSGWCIGTCLYIAVVALVYIAFITICAALVAVPILSLSDSWDGAAADLVYGTSQMNPASLAQLYPTIIPIAVVKYLYPSGATLYTFLTAWASFTLLGMILYLVSLISKNILWGLAATGIIVFLDPILTWFTFPKKFWLQYFSPVCWTSVESLDSVQPYRALNIPTISALYVILLLVSFVAIYYQSKRIMITDLQGNNEQ